MRGANLSANPNSRPNSGMSVPVGVGRHALALGADAGVDRQAILDGPGILEEEADVRRVDVAFGDEALLRVDAVAPHRVVAERAAWSADAARQLGVPVDVTRLRASPLRTLLPTRSTCTPNLNWCSPPALRVDRAVGLEVRARLLVAHRAVEGCCREAGEAGYALQARPGLQACRCSCVLKMYRGSFVTLQSCWSLM